MERYVQDIPEMYSEMMVLMRMQGVKEDSRNGYVLTLPFPLLIRVKTPTRRVVIDPVRRCNPFFHLMEFVWMMAGGNHPRWISKFNKGMAQYADTNNSLNIPIFHGAYGYRWRSTFGFNQVIRAVNMLTINPESRQVVIAMWDAETDMGSSHNDIPCNTHIYLRIVGGCLNMLVCNRSNDVIWGMTGANAVHMTLLQELISNAVGVPIGNYSVLTNNAHVYLDLPNVGEMLETRDPIYPNKLEKKEHVPLLSKDEKIGEFFRECHSIISGGVVNRCNWLKNVALPAKDLWFERKGNLIQDNDWYQACNSWLRL